MCGATPKSHILLRDFQKEIFKFLRRLSLIRLSGEQACEKLLSSVSETARVRSGSYTIWVDNLFQ